MSIAFVGIDVSSDHLDVHVRPHATAFRVRNTPEGHAELHRRLPEPAAVGRVILEATGGLELPVATALAHAGFPVVIINPRQGRRFNESAGTRAKTDAIDAAGLAAFGEAHQPALRPLPAPELQELRDYVDRRDQLVRDRVAEQNRRASTATRALQRDIDDHLDQLNRRIRKLENAIDRLIAGRPEWKANAELLRSIPGIGPQTVRAFTALLPELGSLDRRPLAALVGVAPFNADSGRHTGERHIAGGRAGLRNALYMAAFAATRHNPAIARFYATLRARGKAFKVAVIACARKLLGIANAVIRSQQPWSQPRPLAA